MKVFNSIHAFIDHYNNKKTIPSSVSMIIHGNEHTFCRKSSHSRDTITKSMIDNYSFIEKENFGFEVNLNVHYYRYFELKVILEAYFSFYINEDILLLSPIYFYDKFVGNEDFEPYKNDVSDSLERWTGLKWVNTNRVPDAFNTIRQNAYTEVRKDLFYELPFHIYDEDEDCPEIKGFIDIKRKKEWLLDKDGNSPYFSKPLEVPDYW